MKVRRPSSFGRVANWVGSGICCVVLSSTSCGSPTKVAPEQDTPASWPQNLAGRKLRTSADDFVLYCNSAESSEDLQRWVALQLDLFRSRYGATHTGTGLILAIEPGKEPYQAIEEWRVGPPVGGGIFNRPSCAPMIPYFSESFSIP